jgi:multidrug efflux pump subunit AcrA (membrane-fusion protein)
MQTRTFISKAEKAIYLIDQKTHIKLWFWGIIVSLILFSFLPWTQNIKAKGYVTTLEQEYRPQKVYASIPGKIFIWQVNEGDFVKKGDTILVLSEIKEEYLDPNLINRTQSQLDNKKTGIEFYQGKINTTQQQIENLMQAKSLK